MNTRENPLTALTAIIELRALMGAQVYVGDRVRELIERLRDALPGNIDRMETADILRAYLEATEMERRRGVGPFSLEVATHYLDEIEVSVRRSKAHRA